MPVRQYIGARYVTKVYENSQNPQSAEWEAGVSYEPLMLVTYNYGSYLSKKSVPATVGNPASNPIYWVETGAYNGQITNLQNQINDLKKLGAYINVKYFGATGDGTTDDTVAINAAIDYINDNFIKGAALYFPAGIYKVTSTIQLRYNGDLGGISILGDSQYTSIIEAAGDFDLISYSGDDTVPDYDGYLWGVRVEDIYLKYYGGSSTHTGIDVRYATFFTMKNVRIRYFKTGVYLSNVGDSIFQGVNVSANVAGARGIDTGDRSVSNAFRDCIFAASGNATGINADTWGIYAERGDTADMTINHLEVGHATGGIYIDGQNDNHPSADVNIYGLVCDEVSFGIRIKNYNRTGNMNIIGGWINTQKVAGNKGIDIYNSECINISNVQFASNIIASGALPETHGVYIRDNTSSNIKVDGCIFRNQSSIANNAGSGGTGAKFLTATNNKQIIDSGLSIASTAIINYGDHAVMIGNSFSGVVSRYIYNGPNATNSIMSLNTADGGATSSYPYNNDSGATTVNQNNVDGA